MRPSLSPALKIWARKSNGRKGTRPSPDNCATLRRVYRKFIFHWCGPPDGTGADPRNFSTTVDIKKAGANTRWVALPTYTSARRALLQLDKARKSTLDTRIPGPYTSYLCPPALENDVGRTLSGAAPRTTTDRESSGGAPSTGTQSSGERLRGTRPLARCFPVGPTSTPPVSGYCFAPMHLPFPAFFSSCVQLETDACQPLRVL
ncbi:hypothetical protein FA13DRAFT_1074352 [Coprinellus micaceus]|uniref:Uncharacterized protein n=1 Tax=Coprinellus micaceus TaxID=71717 RepID=A0A4Y7TRV2_COPMI|nr:hypothetical protein FA13DRAFT_1074352 [Coprinellus micaceus]